MILGMDKYKVPDQVILRLEGTEAQFLITLPTRWNKPYTREWQGYLAESATTDEDGTVRIGRVNPREMLDNQQQAFVKHCIMKYPDGLDAELMLGEYLPATEALFTVAQELANEEEARADALSKKPSTSSNGKDDGEANLVSIKSSKSKAKSPPEIGSQTPAAQIG